MITASTTSFALQIRIVSLLMSISGITVKLIVTLASAHSARSTILREIAAIFVYHRVVKPLKICSSSSFLVDLIELNLMDLTDSIVLNHLAELIEL